MRSLEDRGTTLLQVPGMIYGSCNGLKTRRSSFQVFEGKEQALTEGEMGEVVILLSNPAIHPFLTVPSYLGEISNIGS